MGNFNNIHLCQVNRGKYFSYNMTPNCQLTALSATQPKEQSIPILEVKSALLGFYFVSN